MAYAMAVVMAMVAVAVAPGYATSSGSTALSQRLTNHPWQPTAPAWRCCPTASRSSSPRPTTTSSSRPSIHSGLSMVALSSRGRTQTELLDALGEKTRDGLAENVRDMVERAIPADTQPYGPRVVYASALWHEATRKVKQAYRDAAAESCRAAVRAVDFLWKPVDASRQINSWVAEATNNLIESIVGPDSVSKDTQLVVTNALYFKGRWETPFHKSKTMDHEFHRMDGSAIDAQFMSSDKDQFIAVHDGFKVLKMPYETMRQDPVHGRPPRSYSMFVFLPDARDGLWSLEDRIASSPGFISDHLPKKPVAIGEFRVPKFKLSFPASIAKVLQNLGITTVFTPGAELPGMLENNGGPLFVSDVMHKAVIEVNEEGTEAAACTGIFMVGSSRPAPKPPVLVDFVADHPFAFCLVEEVSGAILFTGHVLDPTRSYSPTFL